MARWVGRRSKAAGKTHLLSTQELLEGGFIIKLIVWALWVWVQPLCVHACSATRSGQTPKNKKQK